MNLIQVVMHTQVTYNGHTLMKYKFYNILEDSSYDNATEMIMLKTIKRSS